MNAPERSADGFRRKIGVVLLLAVTVCGVALVMTRNRPDPRADSIRTVDDSTRRHPGTGPTRTGPPQTPPGRKTIEPTGKQAHPDVGGRQAPTEAGESTVPATRTGASATAGAPASPRPGPTEPGTTKPVTTGSTTTTVQDAPAPTTTTTTQPEPPSEPPTPPDVAACANLGLVAVGGTDGTDEGIVRAAPRFRAMAAELQATSNSLVCAKPIVAWRDDLYTQSLYAGGIRLGRLVSGREDHDPVVRLSLDEFAAWQWRSDHNFVGVPTGRVTIDGVEIIRTHRGGVVIESREAIPIPVVNGAWDRWMASGGPSGSMGMPAGRPDGISGFAAWQDFERGRIVLPQVVFEYDAESAPASAFVWFTWEQIGPPSTPPVRAHSVIELTGASYYVGPDLRRHWIRTTDDWYCAKRSGAAMIGPVDGRVLTSFPIGEAYVCPETAPRSAVAGERQFGVGRFAVGLVPASALVDERHHVAPPRKRLVPNRTA